MLLPEKQSLILCFRCSEHTSSCTISIEQDMEKAFAVQRLDMISGTYLSPSSSSPSFPSPPPLLLPPLSPPFPLSPSSSLPPTPSPIPWPSLPFPLSPSSSPPSPSLPLPHPFPPFPPLLSLSPLPHIGARVRHVVCVWTLLWRKSLEVIEDLEFYVCTYTQYCIF